MKKSFLNETILGNFVFISEETRAKKFKVRMFHHLQNLFWGFLSGGFCLALKTILLVFEPVHFFGHLLLKFMLSEVEANLMSILNHLAVGSLIFSLLKNAK